MAPTPLARHVFAPTPLAPHVCARCGQPRRSLEHLDPTVGTDVANPGGGTTS